MVKAAIVLRWNKKVGKLLIVTKKSIPLLNNKKQIE